MFRSTLELAGVDRGTSCRRWRNANNRHPDVIAAQRRERARIRSEKGLRLGGRPALVA